MVARSPRKTPVVTEDITATIERLDRYVGRLEARYECSSEQMTEIVRADAARCTAEIAFWLQSYRALERLRVAVDDATGTLTTTTG